MPVLTFLMTNLKSVAAVMMALLVAYGLHSVSMAWQEHRMQAALDRQHAMLVAACETDKAKTKEANDALQKSAADIAGKLAAYKRLHPVSCVVPNPGMAQPAASRAGYAAGGGEVIGTTDDFRDYFATCESYRQQRIILDEFGQSLK